MSSICSGFSVPFLLNNQVISSALTLTEARYYYLRAGAIFPLDASKNVKLKTTHKVVYFFAVNLRQVSVIGCPLSVGGRLLHTTCAIKNFK